MLLMAEEWWGEGKSQDIISDAGVKEEAFT